MTKLTLDQKIAKIQDKISKVKKWLLITDRAIKRTARKEGWTKELTKQANRVSKELLELTECQNELNACKADRKSQRRIIGK